MATPPIQLGIRITEEALPAFAESIRDALAPVSCLVKTTDCISPENRDAFIRDTLKDGRLDPIEAPALYEVVKLIGGAPVLDGDAIVSFRKATREANAFLEESKIILALSSVSQADAVRLAKYIVRSAEKLTLLIQWAEEMSAESRAQAQSFLHFISAENMWGLSAWITFDGKSFSDAEWAGRRAFTSTLREIDAGLRIFSVQYATGVVADANPMVQTFLQSPFGYASQIPCLFGHLDTCTSDTDAGDLLVLKKMIRLMRDSGTEKMAIYYAEGAITTSSDPEATRKALADVLPSSAGQFMQTDMVTFSNFVASPDSIAMLLAGGGIGRFVLGGTKFAMALPKLSPILRVITPGLPLISASASRGLKARVLVGATNVGYEVAKFDRILWGAAQLSQDEDWLKAVSLTTLFTSSTLGAALSAGYSRVAQAVLGDEVKVALQNGAKGATPAQQQAIAAVDGKAAGLSPERLAAAGDPRTLRLQTDTPGGLATMRDRMAELRNLAAEAAKLRQSLEKAAQARMAELRNLAAEAAKLRQSLDAAMQSVRDALGKLTNLPSKGSAVNPGVLQDLSRRADALLKQLPATAEALQPYLRRVNQFLVEVGDQIARATQPRRAPTPVPASAAKGAAKKRPSVQRQPPIGKGKPAKAPATRTSNESGKKSTVPAEAPKSNGKQPLLSPDEFQIGKIAELSGGKLLQADQGAIGKTIVDWYKIAPPGHRQRLIDALWSLTSTKMKGWKFLKGQIALYQFRIGNMRLIVRRTNSHFTLDEFGTRGNVRIGTSGKSRER